MSKHVFIAMSGGVDSSLSAHLLLESGYKVEGIHFELTHLLKADSKSSHNDLERICRMLNIPLHYVHIENDFKKNVIDYFCEEYIQGRTPNPCIQCNKHIKFGLVLEKIREMGGDFLATGHYARVASSKSGYSLLKGTDPSKDQSYFLYILGQKELSRVLFPVGGMLKSEVKKLALNLGLSAEFHTESQDICFLPDGNYQAFISKRIDSKPGEIVDKNGRVLGQHRGLIGYTIGQRQGMGISSKEPIYVISIDTKTNRLVIGSKDQLFNKKLRVHNLNWISGMVPVGIIKVRCKIRYRAPEVLAQLRVDGDTAEVIFFESQRAVTPGQSIVFYQGDSVLGGGIIGETT